MKRKRFSFEPDEEEEPPSSDSECGSSSSSSAWPISSPSSSPSSTASSRSAPSSERGDEPPEAASLWSAPDHALVFDSLSYGALRNTFDLNRTWVVRAANAAADIYGCDHVGDIRSLFASAGDARTEPPADLFVGIDRFSRVEKFYGECCNFSDQIWSAITSAWQNLHSVYLVDGDEPLWRLRPNSLRRFLCAPGVKIVCLEKVAIRVLPEGASNWQQLRVAGVPLAGDAQRCRALWSKAFRKHSNLRVVELERLEMGVDSDVLAGIADNCQLLQCLELRGRSFSDGPAERERERVSRPPLDSGIRKILAMPNLRRVTLMSLNVTNLLDDNYVAFDGDIDSEPAEMVLGLHPLPNEFPRIEILIIDDCPFLNSDKLREVIAAMPRLIECSLNGDVIFS